MGFTFPEDKRYYPLLYVHRGKDTIVHGIMLLTTCWYICKFIQKLNWSFLLELTLHQLYWNSLLTGPTIPEDKRNCFDAIHGRHDGDVVQPLELTTCDHALKPWISVFTAASWCDSVLDNVHITLQSFKYALISLACRVHTNVWNICILINPICIETFYFCSSSCVLFLHLCI